jgi:hypothetical protein
MPDLSDDVEGVVDGTEVAAAEGRQARQDGQRVRQARGLRLPGAATCGG